MGKVGDLNNDDDAYILCCLKFEKRAEELRKMGYVAVSPMQIVARGTEWVQAMKICIPAMLDCEGVSPLPDTWNSTGGLIEFNLSQQLRMPIIIPIE
jgi:hypothetical protein